MITRTSVKDLLGVEHKTKNRLFCLWPHFSTLKVKGQHAMSVAKQSWMSTKKIFTADCKSPATRKQKGGKPQLIYHVWIWLSFQPQCSLPLCSSSINQLWFSTVQLDCCKTFAIHCTWLQFYCSLALILTIVHTCMSFKTAGCIIFHWFHTLSFHHLLLLLLFLLQSCTTHSMLAFPLTPTHLPCLTSHTVAASVCKL